MKPFIRKQIIWSFGLSDEHTESIRQLAGDQYMLLTWPEGALPDFTNPEELQRPCLICFTLESCRDFSALPVEQTGFLELAPKAVLLDEHAGLAELEEALAFGISDILRTPLTRQRFASTLRRAMEAAALHRDIQNMTNEIFIGREILDQKSTSLSFLVNFLSQVNDSLDEKELLAKTFSCLQRLFPVDTMHAALFSKDENGEITADLFMAAPKDTPAYDAWRKQLMETAGLMAEGCRISPVEVPLVLSERASRATPAEGHIVTLPAHVGENVLFVLMLLTPVASNLSRDQAMAIESALRHMALSLKNARRYQQACLFADRDSLTGAYNRRYFEQVLKAEIARNGRYNGELALLMLDVDHFKNVNDTWGHPKGDEVLRAIASNIMATIRQTDYCVRYGGEEFAILLPQTSIRNATWLAERLRRKIQKLPFTGNKQHFNVTVSIGAASILNGEATEGLELIKLSDRALYAAKNSGRNQVITHTAPPLAMAVPM